MLRAMDPCVLMCVPVGAQGADRALGSLCKINGADEWSWLVEGEGRVPLRNISSQTTVT